MATRSVRELKRPTSWSLGSLSRSVLHLTAIGLALRAALAALSLLNVILLARALGPNGRGEYFLFVAAVAVLARVADLGMSPSAVVFTSRYPGALTAIHRRLGSLLLLFWLVVAALGSLVLLLANGLGDLPREREWLALAVLPFAMYEQVWLHLMVGMRRVVAMNVVQLVGALVVFGLNVALVVLAPGGVPVAVAIYCAVLLVRTPIMVGLAVRSAARAESVTEAPPAMREILSFSLRGYPNALAALLWTRLPAFTLDLFHGAGAVGFFSIAQQVLEQLILPIQAAQDAIYHRVARLDRARATSIMNRYLRLGVWGMLPLVVVSAALAPWVVPLFFGAAFERSVPIFQILLISLLASVVPALLSPYFFGQLQRPGLASTIAWARVLLALGLTLALAPGLAEVGVAIGLAIADVCATLLILVLYARIAGTPISGALLPHRSDFRRAAGP
jgi:O-antigen/teichoic acid export membrane protein